MTLGGGPLGEERLLTVHTLPCDVHMTTKKRFYPKFISSLLWIIKSEGSKKVTEYIL